MSSSSTEDFERIWTCAICKKNQQKILYSLYLEVQHLVGKFVFDEKQVKPGFGAVGVPDIFISSVLIICQKTLNRVISLKITGVWTVVFTCKVQKIIKFKHEFQMEMLK